MRNLLALVLAAAGCLAAAQPSDTSRPVVLENAHARFEFEARGMGLSAMTDRKGNVNHIGRTAGPHLLWEAIFAKGRQQTRITNNSKPCSRAALERRPDGSQRLVLEWNRMRLWLEDNAVSVRVTVELAPASGIARWRILVENRSDYWGLWSVGFPLVNGFPAKGEYDIARPTFGSGGHLLKNASKAIAGRYPSGAWPMQFLSLARGANAVYFGSLDPDARTKDFMVEPGASLSLVHYPENMGVTGSGLPDYYAVELGVLPGNWVEAAQHYREWALRQKWAQAGKVSRRSDIPDSIKNLALWVTEGWDWRPKPGQQPGGRGYITARGWYEAPTDSNAPYLAAQQAMGVPMGVHWYHWHHNKFNHDFPQFLPAREGFKERAAGLMKAGWLVMPYINGYSADLDLPDFDRFAPHASVDEAGGYRMGFYGESAGRLLAMCPTAFWQDTIAEVVDGLGTSYGVNAVYVDQVSAAGSNLCFSPAHGHPRGGGRYWADGYHQLLRKVQDVAQRNGRQMAVTSEGADEIFLDVLAANLTWAQPTDWEIPLMEVVYSGYTLFFASPCDYSRSDNFFRFAQGQALIDGRQNGWMDIGLFQPQYAAKAKYLRQCARFRVAAGEFLTYGRLLRPLDPANSIPTFSDAGFGWDATHRGAAPSAEARLWQSEDGHLAVILANYVDRTVPFSVRVDPAGYGLKGGRFVLSEIAPDGTTGLGSVTGRVEREIALPPASIKAIEIAPL